MSAPTLMAPAADAAPPARQARGRIGGRHTRVLAVRRAVRRRFGDLRLRADRLVGGPELLACPEHRDPWRLGRAAELHRPAAAWPVPGQSDHVHDLRGVHRAADVCAFPRPGAAAQRRQGHARILPFGVLPAHRLLLRRGLAGLEAVDLQRRTVRAGEHRPQLVRRGQHRLAGDHQTRPGTGW